MLITARVALQSGARSLRSVRSAHSRAHSASRHRLPRGLAIGSAGLLAAGLVATEAYRNTISCDADRAQAEDPTRPPSGAKLDGAGEQSTVNALEDIRGQGFDVDPKKDQGKYITLAEVAQHHLAHDNWVVVDGKVFDVTSYTKNHPGGANIIVANAGRDVTELFKPIHPPNTLENNLPANSFKGLVDPEEAAKASTSLALHLPHPCIGSALAYKAEQERVANGRAALPDVETMLSLDELEEAASSFLSPRVVNYYASASLDHVSLADNRTSLNKCRLLPRIMRNVKAVRPQTKIFGVESALPIYVSPASNALLGHPDGELNITRGTGIVQGISAAASYSLTDILAEKDTMEEQTGRKMGMVYQVYLQEDRSKSDELVREAVEGGCQALILTVDSNVHDFRQSNEKLKGTRGDASPGAKMGVYDDTDKYHDARQNWDDLVRLKELAQGVPIYLKGVCHIDDVRLAKEHGLAGCILSNHGGRQLDRARTGFDSLRDIHAQDPNLSKSIELYIDGGFRRGSEVLQAIALGARGVGLGRSFLWAQAAYGEKGVIRAVRILEDEIITAMRLLGITKINEIKPGMVECLQEVWK